MLETGDNHYEWLYNYNFLVGKCLGYLHGTIMFHRRIISLENKYREYVCRHPGEDVDDRYLSMHLNYLECCMAMDEKEKLIHHYVLTNKNISIEKLADKIFRETEYWRVDC